MKDLKMKIQLKIKDNYFLFSYGIILAIGIVFILIQVQNIGQSLGVKLDVFVRFSLFLLNITIPYILWIHFFSRILINHRRIKNKREYIWKSRVMIFKGRRNLYFLYLIIAMVLVIFSLRFFGKSFFEEAYLLGLALIVTLGFPIILLFFFGENSIKQTHKNLSNKKIYSPLHIQSVKDEKIVKESQTEKHQISIDSPISIMVEDQDCFNLHTIQTIYDKCNNKIFVENNINMLYNILNLKLNNQFNLNQKGRFMSLIYLLQSLKTTPKEWDKKILRVFDLDYENDYTKNRKKYINDDIIKDDNMDLNDKIESILNPST